MCLFYSNLGDVAIIKKTPREKEVRKPGRHAEKPGFTP